MKKIIYILGLFLSQLIVGQETIITSKISKHINGEKIIARYFKNIGGEEKIRNIETLQKKFKIEIDDVPHLNMTGEVLYQIPNLYASTLILEQVGEIQTTKYNGENCIMTKYHNNETIEQKIEGQILKEKMKNFYPFPLLEAKKNNLSFIVIEKHTTRDNELYKVHLNDSTSKDSIFLFFDTKTYYLLKKEEIGQKTKKTTEYIQHQQIDGVVFPFLEISTIEIDNNIAQESKNYITEIIINQEISSNKFQ